MCAGTVVEPPVPVSAARVSVTSRSRSVAFSDRRAFSARINTLPRIGMVLRRSTTRWTWPSDFRSCARSTVTFIAISARSQRWKSRAAGRRAAALETRKPGQIQFDQTHGGTARWRGRVAISRERQPASDLLQRIRGPLLKSQGSAGTGSFLELTLQRFDLLRQGRIPGDQCLDFAHGMQHRGVIAAAEAAAD